MLIVAAGMLLAFPAADAFANANVRFVHAVPGGAPASLDVGATELAPVGFGAATGYVSVPAGTQAIRLRRGGRTLTDDAQDLGSGKRYTVVAIKEGSGASLRLVEDPVARGGRARVRVIAAAPELGKVDVGAGGNPLATGLAFGDASSRTSLEPGSYPLSAMRPGGRGGALVNGPSTAFAAGTASTVVLLGSGGERLRFLNLGDNAVTPSAAPATGFGGLSGGGSAPVLLALMAALGAAVLGGSGYGLAARRRGR